MGAPRRRRSRDPVKPPRGYHLDPPTPGLAPSGEPGLEDRLGPAWDHVQQPGRTTAVAHGSQVNDDGDIAVAPPGVAPHRGGTSRTRAKRAGESSTPRASTPLNRSGASLRICSARVRIALLAVCQEIPRAAATRQTDMHSRARARSPPTPPPSASAGSWPQPGLSCPASTLDGSGCRRSAARAPPAAWASTPPARGPGAGPPSHGILPERRRLCKRGPQTRSACGTPQWLSSRSGADPPRTVPGRPAPGRSSDQGRRR